MPSKVAATIRAAHAGPSVAVSAITAGLGVAAGLDPFRTTVLGVAMLAGQLSVGLSNDWIDAPRDAATGRTDKPIAQGLVSGLQVRNAALACAALMVVLAIPLGWMAELALLLSNGAGWVYNAGLKKSIASVVAYLVGFGALPAIATFSRQPPAAPAPWTIAAGALLGAAAHFANTLPDLEDDAATGVRGLPQRLGRLRASALTYLVLLGASVIEFLGTGGPAFLPADVGLVAAVAISLAGGTIILRPSRWHFRLIILAAMIDVVVLVLAGHRVLA